MSLIKQRASEARSLLADHVFQAVIGEIRDDAVGVFLNAACDINRVAAAHENVRAVQLILDALQARLDAEIVEAKQDRDRAND
ncbi:hypothetical protein UFOVP373_34 [uncultured Caudovirales phage]|uniref:Uncharacterized protein n=1 Tax=uncultured Caudovirales phage TaxID=2100421 RepID=A0A6J7X1I8_9CAUD|nr:hypothetical protein UFOVP373_34 [uncultured Caudovirales phage]